MRSLIAHSDLTGGFLARGKRARRRLAADASSSVAEFLATAGPDAVPRWLGWACAAALFGLTAVYGAVAGGQAARILDFAGAMAGLAISEIKISGQAQLDEIDVLEALEIQPGSSLVAYDAAGALDRLSGNGWIAAASVRKIYPGTLKIELTERRPLALWQRGSLVSLIDAEGTVISDVVSGRFAALPLFVGHGANQRADDFLGLLDRFPAIRSRLRAAVYVSERRWDLVLDNAIEVNLPEANVEAALDELLRLNAESGLMTRDIVSVDLRLEGEVVVRLSDEAVTKRKATLKRRAGGKRETDT